MQKKPLPPPRELFKNIYSKLWGMICAGWYYKGDPESIDRKRILSIALSSNVVANLIGGSFYTGLLLLLNASDSFIGMLTMITTGANMLQLLAPVWLERFASRKKILIGMRCVVMILNVLLIGFIPIFPIAYQSKLVLVALTVLTVNLVNAFMAPGMTVWHLQSIPLKVRNHYYSLQTMAVGIIVALINLGASALVDIARAAGSEYAGLLALRIICAVLVVFETIWLFRIKEYPYPSSGRRFTIKALFTEPFRQPKYLKTVLVAFLWSFTCNVPGPYYTIYLLKDMKVDYSYIMLVNMLNVPILVLLTPLWSKLVEKFSWFKSLYLAMGLYMAHYICLAFVTPSTSILYPLAIVYAFIMMTGISLCFTSVPYVNIPEHNQTVYIGFYSTIANMGSLLGVALGQQFIAHTESIHINLFGVMMGNKQYLMLLAAALMFIASVIIFFIRRSLPAGES